MRRSWLVLACSTAWLLAGPAVASDHADPVELEVLEAGITDLHAFPVAGDLILSFAVRRALTAAPPYELEPFEYTIHMDLHSAVDYDGAADRARYGGTVADPTGIRADVTLRFQLHDDATLRQRSFSGLLGEQGVRVWTGVRDDPFIFPPFFGTNVIAIVVAVPFAAFPPGQQDWLLWGTTTRVSDGEQVDHVGRSIRTQLPRFGFLNSLPPSRQVAAIHAKAERGARIQRLLMRVFPPAVNLFQPLFAIRPYDLAPDVMVFTTRYPVGYPNGRLLTDDVVLLTCQFGDCLLYDLTYAGSAQWPRATTNDKPFLAEFPYLADPWPAKPPAPAPRPIPLPLVIGVAVVLLLVPGFVLCWLLGRWRRRRRAAPLPLKGDAR
jgi:hypothetical protein